MIQKVKIISNIICYGSPPGFGDEVEQHFTVSSNGRIWFNGYNYVGGFGYYQKGRSIQMSIGKEQSKKLLELIEEYMKSGLEIIATDCGFWNIKVTGTNGEVIERSGSLIDEIYVGDTPISATIRKVVPIEDMYLFDGNYSKDDEEFEDDK